MRISYPNMMRPKSAAKKIAARIEAVPLSKVQAIVARSAGYLDWNDLNRNHNALPPSKLDQDWDTGAAFIFFSHLASELLDCGATVGNSVDAAADCRLSGDRVWSQAERTQLLFTLWRKTETLGSKRHQLGSLVRVEGRSKEYGYLCNFNGLARILQTGGFLSCADFEVVTPRIPPQDFLPKRLWLPYGYWKLDDDSEIAYSRDYLPMWRVVDDRVERLPPWLWIGTVKSEHWFGDERVGYWESPIAEQRALDYLKKMDILRLPMLAEVLPKLLGQYDITIKSGVARLMEETKRPDPTGPWWRSNLV